VGNVKVGSFLRDETTGSVSTNPLGYREVFTEMKACICYLESLTRIKLWSCSPCPQE
jgi:hypothetical protein